LNQASDTIAETRDEAHLVLFSPMVMVAGQSMYLATTVAIYWFFKDVTPAGPLKLWSIIAVCGLSVSGFFCLAFILRRPGPSETLRFWRKIDKRLTHVFDTIAIAAIFLLFPHGDEKHRMVALAYCVGYGPMQLITDPENIWANRISVVAILSAFATQLWLSGNSAALILTIMFVLYGAMLIVAAGVFHKSVTETVAGKQASERAEKQMRAAHAEASQSRDAKTRFIASASHDLGQPLQAASLFVRQLTESGRTKNHVNAVTGLEQAIGQALVMVRHMLQFLRLEADQVKPNCSPVDVSSVLQAAAQLSGEEARLADVTIKICASSIHLNTDSSLLQRAVDNLLGNALKHGKGSKVLMGLKSSGHGKHRLWVIDNGIGVPKAEQEYVFQDYAQGSKASLGGFGLGLSSVRRIAILLGGTAGIDPRWRNGCATFIELPTL
jgi:signal transduction histidine kinase